MLKIIMPRAWDGQFGTIGNYWRHMVVHLKRYKTSLDPSKSKLKTLVPYKLWSYYLRMFFLGPTTRNVREKEGWKRSEERLERVCVRERGVKGFFGQNLLSIPFNFHSPKCS